VARVHSRLPRSHKLVPDECLAHLNRWAKLYQKYNMTPEQIARMITEDIKVNRGLLSEAWPDSLGPNEKIPAAADVPNETPKLPSDDQWRDVHGYTAADLIEELRKLPPDTPIVARVTDRGGWLNEIVSVSNGIMKNDKLEIGILNLEERTFDDEEDSWDEKYPEP